MLKFHREKFFPMKKNFDSFSIVNYFKNNIIKNRISKNFKIKDVSSLDFQRENSVLFLNNDINILNIEFESILLITEEKKIFNINKFNNIILVKSLNDFWNCIINEIYIHEDALNYEDEFISLNNSNISKYAKIDETSKIHNNCVIGRGVEIGKNCIIKNNVVIKNSIIKNNVVICDNTSIGTTGFGFDYQKRGSDFLNPQIGAVIIDDNVHIGASCTIDRGKIDSTFIGKNSMIDNLVHIAHNVIIGKNACIAAQTGISGSVIIGNNVTVGGKVGFAGHIKIGDNVVIAARSGVTKNIKENSVVAGFPAIDIREWKKNIIRNRKNGY